MNDLENYVNILQNRQFRLVKFILSSYLPHATTISEKNLRFCRYNKNPLNSELTLRNTPYYVRSKSKQYWNLEKRNTIIGVFVSDQNHRFESIR